MLLILENDGKFDDYHDKMYKIKNDIKILTKKSVNNLRIINQIIALFGVDKLYRIPPSQINIFHRILQERFT